MATPAILQGKIAGIDKKVFLVFLVIAIGGALYLRKRKQDEETELAEDEEILGDGPFDLPSVTGVDNGLGGTGLELIAGVEDIAEQVDELQDELQGLEVTLPESIEDAQPCAGVTCPKGYTKVQESIFPPRCRCIKITQEDGNPCARVNCGKGYHKVKRGKRCACVRNKKPQGKGGKPRRRPGGKKGGKKGGKGGGKRIVAPAARRAAASSPFRGGGMPRHRPPRVDLRALRAKVAPKPVAKKPAAKKAAAKKRARR